MKHTPGPWIFSEEESAIDGEEDILIEHEGFPLATVRGTNDMSCIDEEDVPAHYTSAIAWIRILESVKEITNL